VTAERTVLASDLGYERACEVVEIVVRRHTSLMLTNARALEHLPDGLRCASGVDDLEHGAEDSRWDLLDRNLNDLGHVGIANEDVHAMGEAG